MTDEGWTRDDLRSVQTKQNACSGLSGFFVFEILDRNVWILMNIVKGSYIAQNIFHFPFSGESSLIEFSLLKVNDTFFHQLPKGD